MNGKRMIRFGLALACAAVTVLSSGCATMKVGVDVYKGDLIMDEEARLGVAVGIARVCRERAALTRHHLEYEDQSKWRGLFKKMWLIDKPDHTKAVQLIRRVMDIYDEEEIETNWDRYRTPSRAPAGQRRRVLTAKPEVERQQVRAALAKGLSRFAGACRALGQDRTVTAIAHSRLRPFFLHLSPTSARGDLASAKSGVFWEEKASQILYLVDSVVNPCRNTQIGRLMKSMTPGLAVEIARNTGAFREYAAKYADALEEEKWAQINVVNVLGAGEAEFVIIKDEIGNWHIKRLVADQDELVNVLFDGATALAQIAAARYGPVVPAKGAAATGGQTLYAKSRRASEGNRVLRRLRAARAGLRNPLDGIAPPQDPDPEAARKALREQLLALVETHLAELQSIRAAWNRSAGPPQATDTAQQD